MKMMVKAAGPRTIVLGSTGCMYVANTTYYSTVVGRALDAHPARVERFGGTGDGGLASRR
jgi:hypothetical protein